MDVAGGWGEIEIHFGVTTSEKIYAHIQLAVLLLELNNTLTDI